MELKNSLCIMLFGKIFYMIHRTISVRFLRDTIRNIFQLGMSFPREFKTHPDLTICIEEYTEESAVPVIS